MWQNNQLIILYFKKETFLQQKDIEKKVSGPTLFHIMLNTIFSGEKD